MYGKRVPDAISFICKGFKTMCSCFGLWHYSSIQGVSEIIWGDFNMKYYTNTWKLIVNETKTKVMIFCQTKVTKKNLNSYIMLWNLN